MSERSRPHDSRDSIGLKGPQNERSHTVCEGHWSEMERAVQFEAHRGIDSTHHWPTARLIADFERNTRRIRAWPGSC